MNDAIDQRELTFMALAGLAGGALGWIPVELVSHGHTITQVEDIWTQIAGVVSMALFWGLVGGLIVGAQGKSLHFTPAVTRRFLTGLVVCFLIGLPAVYYSNVVFTKILSAGGWGANQAGSEIYLRAARVIGWVLMGFICGAGVGLASGSLKDFMGSLRNIVKGAVGGWVGGFVGGVAFDIIGANASGLYARLFGLCALGLAVGLLIGLVQELTKSAWLNVEAGRLRGRSFNIDRSVATLGRAEENVVGLFGDPGVQPRHAVIEHHGDNYLLKNLAVRQGVFLNGNRIETAELNEGDRIKISDYELSFHLKRASAGPRPAVLRQDGAPAKPAVPPHVGRMATPCLVDATGRRYELRPRAPTSLGRAIDNDIVIADASVSRRHASI
ncbi:MAG TPA: FHA domain-containing protein, partial [Candidatus Binataceae bacterium]|nr:FHA domain-containing protein [Candidatus Binataceae bacterium]